MSEETPWTFDRWFVAQHGSRPSTRSSYELEEVMVRAKYAALSAETMYRRVEEWEAMRNSALYAWQIKDTNKRP